MTFFVAITTYSRIDYLKQLINSIIEFSGNHKYIVAINDDGSKDGTREYLKGLKDTENIKFKVFFSNHKGSYFSTNTLFNYSESLDFDLGFKIEDDLYFIRKGWEELYYNAYKKSGFSHLSHYSIAWTGENKTPKRRGKLVSYTNVWNSQGTFYTFTKETLQKVGYLDNANFGKRGEGHRDWSLRACRLGMNEKDRFWDAKYSSKYIRLHLKKGYVLTPNYDKELEIAKRNAPKKIKFLKDETRTKVEMPESFINHYFDHVYLINLKRRPDRLKKMKSLLKRLKIEFTLVEAVDGEKIKSVPKGLNSGIVGCHLSHLKVLKDIQKKGFEQALILEDDLMPHKEFEDLLTNLHLIPKDWKLLYIGTADWENKSKRETPFYQGKDINSTFAYSVKKEIVEELIRMFEKPITKPCDTLLHSAQKKHKTYVLNPQPFIADVSNSDLRAPRDMEVYAKRVNWNLENYDCNLNNHPKPTQCVYNFN